MAENKDKNKKYDYTDGKEKDPKDFVRTNYYIRQEQKDKIDKIAFESKQKKSEVIRDIINYYFDNS